MPERNPTTPSVFISYSWSSAEYADRVEQLARHLSADGIHVVLDQWDLREGQDKNAFMERCVTDQAIARVLILLDSRYAERADQRHGGVGTETLIISAQVYRQADQEKFIPVVMERNPDGSIPLPTYLTDRIYIDFSDPETESHQYQRLVRNIFRKPERDRPPLGTPPSYLRETNVLLATGRSLATFKDAVYRGRVNTLGYLEDYINRLVLAISIEHIGSSFEKNPPDEQVVRSLGRLFSYRNEYLEFIHFLTQHVSEITAFERLHEFFERLIKIRNETGSFEHSVISWMTWELFLCTTAALFHSARFNAISALLEPYFVESADSGRGGIRDFCTINAGFDGNEQRCLERLKLNHFDLLTNTPPNPTLVPQVSLDISLDSLTGVDLLLWYRAATNYGYWNPRTLLYAQQIKPPSLFLRASSRRFFERISPLLGVANREEFIQRFTQITDVNFCRVGNIEGKADLYKRLMNVERIATRG